MSKRTENYLWSIVIFIFLYGLFVIYFPLKSEDAPDVIVGTTFFFTLFIGYFITRQNDRYSSINDQLTSNDGWFSYLYRITGLVPRIQKEVKEIIRDHYLKIVQSKNLAYHVTHPSNTLTNLTNSLGSITEDESSKPAVDGAWGFLFEVISDLQVTRKKILNLYGEKLVPFQWVVVYVLALLLIVSFNFVPPGPLIDVLKICFGTAVFVSILLLKQLDDLTLFGDTAGMEAVRDVLRIVDEKDATELKKAKK